MEKQQKIKPNGHQSRVIDHHLAQTEGIPTRSYQDMSLDRLTEWAMGWLWAGYGMAMAYALVINWLWIDYWLALG